MFEFLKKKTQKHSFHVLAFVLLFGLIPYRLCGLFHIEFYHRLGVMVISVILFYFILKRDKRFIPFLLNFRLVQALFYRGLQFENFVYGMHPILRLIFLISFGFNLGAWPSYADDPCFYYFLFLFLYTFYGQLKRIFLNPDFVGSIYPNLLLKESEVTWNLIIRNMSSVCISVFEKPVTNQLGTQAGKRSLPNISRRYMFSGFFRGVKSNPEAVGVATSLGAAVGYGVSEINQNKINEATVEVAKRANEQAKRANDLKVQENILKEQEFDFQLNLQKLDRKLITPEDFLKKYHNKDVAPAQVEKSTALSCREESYFLHIVSRFQDIWFF